LIIAQYGIQPALDMEIAIQQKGRKIVVDKLCETGPGVPLEEREHDRRCGGNQPRPSNTLDFREDLPD